MHLLDRYSLSQVCYLLNEIEGKDLSRQREILTQWFVKNGGNQSEAEELIVRQGEFSETLAVWRQEQADLWAKKLEEDQLREKELRKQGRWDEEHHCEIPAPNTPDLYEQRFGGGNGTAGTKSADVDWKSNS